MVDKKLLERIKKLSCHKDWEIREDAADEIKKVNGKSFKEYYEIWKHWASSSNPNIRRAVEVGLLRINKKYVKEALELIEPLLYDSNKYVRKNCGPFALSHICYRNPDFAFKKIRGWMRVDDTNVKWNVAMCLGAWFGQTYHEKALELLKILTKDKRRFVWRAVASSLIKLLRKHPEYKKKVYSWRGIDNVIEVVKKYIEKTH